MPVENNWEPRGLHIRYLGDNTGEELISAALEASGDPRFDDLRYVISDWSQSESSTVNVNDVEVLAAYITAMSRSNPNVFHGSVMPPGEARQALVQLYVMLTEDIAWKTDWFHTEKEAREWVAQESNQALSA